MFQTFTSNASPGFGETRLELLRREMRAENLSGFLVPSTGPWLGSGHVPADRRLAWTIGFTGSAGLLIVLGRTARLFVDGRYTVQAGLEVDTNLVTVVALDLDRIVEYLAEGDTGGNARSIGYDPRVHSRSWIENLVEKVEAIAPNCCLCPCGNLVDRIWSDRPERPMFPMRPYPVARAGRTSRDKRNSIAKKLRGEGCRSALITAPDSIAWLLNTRGSDIERIPVTEAFAVIGEHGTVKLFMHHEKADNDLRAHLGPETTIHPPDDLEEFLENAPGPIMIDPAQTSDRLFRHVTDSGARVVRARDPIVLAKAIKNEAELRGIEKAHQRDGVAFVEFLSWLFGEFHEQRLSEIDLVRKLESCRRATGELRDIAFDTICGSGPNGAIAHYRVTESTNRTINDNDVVVIDSGGQYEDGTTDITRTLVFGNPEERVVRAYTLVLKGMIAMSRLRWPSGIAGCHIDAIARVPLWGFGLDYDHGTGHGVGAYLDVHEGPHAISRRSDIPLEAGMIVSNEPGYYRTKRFGIRIENLLAVRRWDSGPGERGMLEFRTLTLAPLEHRLIDSSLLQQEEIDWLDSYHDTVFESLSPHCTPDAAAWLGRACRKIDVVEPTAG